MSWQLPTSQGNWNSRPSFRCIAWESGVWQGRCWEEGYRKSQLVGDKVREEVVEVVSGDHRILNILYLRCLWDIQVDMPIVQSVMWAWGSKDRSEMTRKLWKSFACWWQLKSWQGIAMSCEDRKPRIVPSTRQRKVASKEGGARKGNWRIRKGNCGKKGREEGFKMKWCQNLFGWSS